MGQYKDVPTDTWGAKGLPNGQPMATWYDKYGRSFVLPADAGHSLIHYREKGLRLTPPESPEPLPVDNDWSVGSINATRGGPSEEPPEAVELFGGLPFAEEPPKKPRKKRAKRSSRA